MADVLVVVVFVIVLVAIFAAAIFGMLWASGWRSKKKIAELTSFAQQRGWTYQKDAKGYSDRFTGAPMNRHKRDDTVRDLIIGTYRGRPFCAFEYKRIARKGTDRKNEASYSRVLALATPATRPTMEVKKAGFGSKVADFLGAQDLPVGHPEFDQAFRVTTDHEQFARDVLAPSVADWLLRDGRALQMPFRFERNELVTWQNGRTKLEIIEPALDFLCDVLDRVPPAVWRQ